MTSSEWPNPFAAEHRALNFPGLEDVFSNHSFNDSLNDSSYSTGQQQQPQLPLHNCKSLLDLSMNSAASSAHFSIGARAALHEHLRHVARFGLDESLPIPEEQTNNDHDNGNGNDNDNINASFQENPLDIEWDRLVDGSAAGQPNISLISAGSDLGGGDPYRVLWHEQSSSGIHDLNHHESVEVTCAADANDDAIDASTDDMIHANNQTSASDYFDSSRVWQLTTPEKNHNRRPVPTARGDEVEVSYSDDDESRASQESSDNEPSSTSRILFDSSSTLTPTPADDDDDDDDTSRDLDRNHDDDDDDDTNIDMHTCNMIVIHDSDETSIGCGVDVSRISISESDACVGMMSSTAPPLGAGMIPTHRQYNNNNNMINSHKPRLPPTTTPAIEDEIAPDLSIILPSPEEETSFVEVTTDHHHHDSAEDDPSPIKPVRRTFADDRITEDDPSPIKPVRRALSQRSKHHRRAVNSDIKSTTRGQPSSPFRPLGQRGRATSNSGKENWVRNLEHTMRSLHLSQLQALDANDDNGGKRRDAHRHRNPFPPRRSPTSLVSMSPLRAPDRKPPPSSSFSAVTATNHTLGRSSSSLRSSEPRRLFRTVVPSRVFLQSNHEQHNDANDPDYTHRSLQGSSIAAWDDDSVTWGPGCSFDPPGVHPGRNTKPPDW